MSLRLPSQGVHSFISYYSCPRSTINPLSMRRVLTLYHLRDAKLPTCARSQFSKVTCCPYPSFPGRPFIYSCSGSFMHLGLHMLQKIPIKPSAWARMQLPLKLRRSIFLCVTVPLSALSVCLLVDASLSWPANTTLIQTPTRTPRTSLLKFKRHMMCVSDCSICCPRPDRPA
jgi:hypothetical protein